MLPVSANFLEALKGSHQQIVRLDAWRGGQLMSSDPGLPVSDGSVTITAGQAIRTALSATITDPDGLWIPAPDGALSPYGSELHVQLGVQAAGIITELVSVCWSPITVATTTERWQSYAKPTGGMSLVSRGQGTVVTGTDRAQIVAGAQFMARTQPVAATVLVEIGQLLQGIVPWQPPAGLADAAIPAGITYDDDRLKAVGDLAAVLNCDLIFDSTGTATLITRGTTDTGGSSGTTGTSVWTIPVRGGAVVTYDKELNSDATYNGVIVRGTAFNGATLIGQAVITSGPLTWNGPFGQVPYFVTSATYGTQAAVDAAAQAQLARLVSQRSQVVQISCVANPALEVGDTVTVPSPYGSINGVVTAIVLPLTPGPMTLSVAFAANLLQGTAA